MTPPASAVAIVREIYTAVAAGDFEAVLMRLHDDVQVHQAASLPFGGTWRGKAGFQEMAARIVAAWPGFSVVPHVFLTDGHDNVVVAARIRGAGLDMDLLERWTVRDGRVITCQPFYFDSALAAATAQQA